MRKPLAAATLGIVMAALSVDADAGAGLRGSSWTVESVKDAAPFDRSKTSFTVSADGRVATTIGCNRIGGNATIGKSKISIGPLMATRMGCPEGLMDLEQRYTSALEQAATYAIEGQTLRLLDAEDQVIITMTRSAAQP